LAILIYLRKTDILARLGSDEFGLLLYQCPLEASTTDCQYAAGAGINTAFVWEDKTFSINSLLA